MSALPSTVDYSRSINHASKYKRLQVPLSNNATSSYVASDSSLKLQWTLPAGVTANPARTSISYTISVGVPGAAGRFTYVVDDCFQIAQNLSWTTAKGVTLADVPFANRYSKVVDKYYTRHSNFMSRTNMDMSYPCRTTTDLNPIHQIPAAVITPNTYDFTGTGVGGNRDEGLVNYEEPRYFKVGGDNQVLDLAKNVKLGDAGRSSLFELDRDIFIGETMYINLDTAPVKTFAFYATSATVIGATAAALGAGKVTISNIMLNLAVEDNAVLSESVRAKWESSGINLRTDYILPFRNVCNSAMTNITLQIPQMAGTKLKRIINCVFNGTEELDKVADQHNLNAEKIQELNTFIDSQQLQNSNVVSNFSTGSYLGNTDYIENEKFLHDSVIQTVPQYAYSWAFIDDFSGDDSLKYEGENQRHDYGLGLEVPRNYMLKMKTPNAAATNLAEYSFAILSRTLHMGKEGSQWLA
jgi:hypothetical protein